MNRAFGASAKAYNRLYEYWATILLSALRKLGYFDLETDGPPALVVTQSKPACYEDAPPY